MDRLGVYTASDGVQFILVAFPSPTIGKLTFAKSTPELNTAIPSLANGIAFDVAQAYLTAVDENDNAVFCLSNLRGFQ